MPPKVSVVVPVRNVKPYLQAGLDALRAQTLNQTEIICVDSGSTDGSGDILDTIAALDKRIVVIHKDAVGYGVAVNTGMDAACGEYLGIAEPDDLTDWTMYEKLYAVARQHHAQLVKSSHYEFSTRPDGSLKKRYRPLDPKNRGYYDRVVDLTADFTPYLFERYSWAGIYSLDYLRSHGISHHESHGSGYLDSCFWLQSLMHAHRAVFLSQPLYLYRRDNPPTAKKDSDPMAVKHEYDYLEALIRNSPRCCDKLLEIFAYAKFQSFCTNLKRLDDELRAEFLKAFQTDFLTHREEGIINPKLFSRRERFRLSQVLKNRMPLKDSRGFWSRLFSLPLGRR